LLISSTIQ